MTLNQYAKSIGLLRGRGLYNGSAYWVRPVTFAIVTLTELKALMHGYTHE